MTSRGCMAAADIMMREVGVVIDALVVAWIDMHPYIGQLGDGV